MRKGPDGEDSRRIARYQAMVFDTLFCAASELTNSKPLKFLDPFFPSHESFLSSVQEK